MSKTNFLPKVKEQYEVHPYPHRDVQEEKTRLINPFLDQLSYINFYCFEGKQDFKNFRTLVAGGGTGDTTIFLAEQLLELGGSVIHLDLSDASIAIAKERAEIRGLDNIEFVHGSILDLPSMKHDAFDYINCSGVLHHMESPDAGLAALRDVLADDGAMGIMLYAKYGRTGLYHMQKLMQLICKNVDDPATKLDLCKRVLKQLPETHWLHFNKDIYGEDYDLNDADLYDMFLHSQDVPFTVGDVYDFVERADLNFLTFTEILGLAEIQYNPMHYTNSPQLQSYLAQFDVRRRQEIAECISGRLYRHSFYVSKQPRTPLIKHLHEAHIPYFLIQANGGQAAKSLYDILFSDPNNPGIIHNQEANISVPVTKQTYTLEMLLMIDGKNSCGDVVDAVIQKHGLDSRANWREAIMSQLQLLCFELSKHDWLHIKENPAFEHLTGDILQTNMQQRQGY